MENMSHKHNAKYIRKILQKKKGNKHMMSADKASFFLAFLSQTPQLKQNTGYCHR